METLKKAGKFISKKDFIAFLKKEIKNKAKTYKCERTNCPLARATGFAVDQGNYSLYPQLLDTDLYGKEHKGVIEATPEWARDFIYAFDDTNRPKNAKTALMIMEKKEEFADLDTMTVYH